MGYFHIIDVTWCWRPAVNSTSYSLRRDRISPKTVNIAAFEQPALTPDILIRSNLAMITHRQIFKFIKLSV